uniref:Uncharacterized protein LOC114348569 n=1 Tax=Diabrotica virgifera virgifera TaxID=50390 RepID=A0A6P7HGW5_DIAVI
MGKVNISKPPTLTSLFCQVEDTVSLDQQIKKFWELEAVPEVFCLAPDDAKVENMFMNTYTREHSGRFVVDLPFKEENPVFPNIRSLALSRFYSLERRLQKSPELYDQYRTFMKEFVELGHMEPVTIICTILINFRLHGYVITADISKVYRQILINPTQTDYQGVLWRSNNSEPVRINRVVYGLSCSPYLAIRCLHQLANDDGDSFPLAAEALKTGTYVDDIVSSCPSFENALALRDELIALLAKGGFELKKWSSNVPDLLKGLAVSDLAIKPLTFNDDISSKTLKVLGLEWDASSDTFAFKVQVLDSSCTKRHLLSNLAKIFDPLGFLSPITFLIKHLIQRIWTQKIGWDDAPSKEIIRLWKKYIDDVAYLSKLNLPRRLLIDDILRLEVHCFGDASEKGYCAVLYFRCLSPSGQPFVSFVTAKSKVAPINKGLTIPRLELSAAVLVARLVSFVSSVIKDKVEIKDIYCYSDSAVTLRWLQSSPNQWKTFESNRVAYVQDSAVTLRWLQSSPHHWKTFVSNRVAYVQERVASSCWHYVPSEENPADIGSRGCLPSELINCSKWWEGPTFSHSDPLTFFELNSNEY